MCTCVPDVAERSEDVVEFDDLGDVPLMYDTNGHIVLCEQDGTKVGL